MDADAGRRKRRDQRRLAGAIGARKDDEAAADLDGGGMKAEHSGAAEAGIDQVDQECADGRNGGAFP